MHEARRATVCWISTDEPIPGQLPSLFVNEPGFISRLCRASGLERCLGELTRDTGPPEVAIIGSDIEHPLRTARLVHRLIPFAHILFPVEAENLADFRAMMSVAPMIGTNWSIIDPQPRSVLAAIEAAIKASRQRRHLRTSLDTINVRLGADQPPSDSADYRKLVVSDSYLATILQHAQDAIISMDPEARVASWNRGAGEMFGYDQQAALNLRLRELIAPRHQDQVRRWFEAAANGRAVLRREVECLRMSGGRLIAEVTFAPIRDAFGDVVAVSLTARDETERKRTEEELRRARVDLEDRVEQRTAALRAVNKELEAFTYSASHDLRAPLRGIDGFSQALMDDYESVLDEPARRYIERIRAAAGRMGEIIDSLLMLSSISRVELHPQKLDLGRLAREIVDELRVMEPERNVVLDVEPDLLVRADPQLMRSALENLLGNAWKFTREREVATIELGKLPDRNEPTFFVRDNGAGFDMTYGQKLFEPFQRLHHPARFEGTGIGLGTVQRIMARHGGRVWGHGVPERGATFYFCLPADPVGPDLVEIERPS
jgi:PAS domain S-box-containing protein